MSTICVQKPRLAFQDAKLAFKAALIASGLGRYYATESMLVRDPTTGRYAAATPSTVSETLLDFYARSIAGEVAMERGDNLVF